MSEKIHYIALTFGKSSVPVGLAKTKIHRNKPFTTFQGKKHLNDYK
jgi:hypothetical protein